MFRKILIVAMFATAVGYCFAADFVDPQIVTSEVFYDQDVMVDENTYTQVDVVEVAETDVPTQPQEIPAWPLVGSDADVRIACEGGACSKINNQTIFVSFLR